MKTVQSILASTALLVSFGLAPALMPARLWQSTIWSHPTRRI